MSENTHESISWKNLLLLSLKPAPDTRRAEDGLNLWKKALQLSLLATTVRQK
jgi:hypothetical protein